MRSADPFDAPKISTGLLAETAHLADAVDPARVLHVGLLDVAALADVPADVEPGQFGDAKTSRIQRLEDRPVAQRPRVITLDRAEERVDLLLGERLRDALGHPRRAHLVAGIPVGDALVDAEPVERAHRHERPGDPGLGRRQ